MFDYKHYVPILKAKEGEFKALQETLAATKDNMTPLLEIVPVPWDYDDDAESKTIDLHFEKIGRKILDCWGNNRDIFIDSNLIDSNRKMTDGNTHHLIYLFNDFNAKGLHAIPVTGLDRHNDYKAAIKSIFSRDNRGICLRLTNIDLVNPNLTQNINTDLAFYNINPTETDLIIDLESISGNSADLVVLTTSTVINSIIPHLNDWRSLTVSASSFPTDLRDITANTIDTIERTEWKSWLQLLNMNLKRRPAFGDYSIAHPDLVDLDPRIITISASIRYTHDNYWLIVRGSSTKRFGFSQYHQLCSNLIIRPEYSGATFSWGDNYINECALQRNGPGNAMIWRKVGNSHHFQKVVTQISNLP